jgi:hypothetical protein
MYLGKVTGDSQQYNFHNEQVRLHLGKSKKKATVWQRCCAQWQSKIMQNEISKL